MVSDLLSVIDKIGSPVDIVGHSMGGKVAMLLAFLHPSYVRRLAVIDIAPVRYEHSQLDRVLALLKVDLSKISKMTLRCNMYQTKIRSKCQVFQHQTHREIE